MYLARRKKVSLLVETGYLYKLSGCNEGRLWMMSTLQNSFLRFLKRFKLFRATQMFDTQSYNDDESRQLCNNKTIKEFERFCNLKSLQGSVEY